MKKYLENICQLMKFGIVGILNTLIGTSVMFFAYNILNLGYWPSSALNYIVGSIFSYFANKYFTFKSGKRSAKEILRFIINIVCCYTIAYGLAEPAVSKLFIWIGLNTKREILEQTAMVLGMVFFVIINFIGQKLFVFRAVDEG